MDSGVSGSKTARIRQRNARNNIHLAAGTAVVEALYLRGGFHFFHDGRGIASSLYLEAAAAVAAPPCDVSDAITRACLFIERG